jgi:hypothetical protein
MKFCGGAAVATTAVTATANSSTPAAISGCSLQ